jgi:hypothetical protein
MNINDNVRFRLTDDGRRVIREFHWRQAAQLGISAEQATDWFRWCPADAEGYHTEQLWVLMQMLGPSLFMGGPTLIERNELEIVP